MNVLPPIASLLSAWEVIFGADGAHANSGQMAMRTLLVYGAAVGLVRLGNKRTLSRTSALDVILSIVLGSVLSRGINGSSTLLPTLASAATLVGAHWFLAMLSFHFPRFGSLLKGEAQKLIEGGRIIPEGLRGSHISESDLRESLRIEGKLDDPAQVECARLERSGDISVLKAETGSEGKRGPRILEISVADGVQTVRLQVE